jgi:hypothetical protein
VRDNRPAHRITIEASVCRLINYATGALSRCRELSRFPGILKAQLQEVVASGDGTFSGEALIQLQTGLAGRQQDTASRMRAACRSL